MPVCRSGRHCNAACFTRAALLSSPLGRGAALVLAALALWLPISRADEQQYPPSLVAPTEPLSPEEERQKFHLPPGFVIELIASEPAIYKPMNLNFDSRGRLYVTSSLEYPFPARGEAKPRDTVQVLADRDGDGRYESVSLIVGGLNIPIGVTPVEDGIIYYSIPNIYRWRGDVEQSDGQPGKLLYGTFGFNDTHGMTNSFTRGIDGWLYACHGFSNTSNVEGADRRAFGMNSGNTYRMRIDGSHAEQLTHGQVNPFGLCFDPLGNLYSADCHTMPVYQLLRGAYYPSFGKPDDGLGFGPTMIGHSHGSTGIAGVVYYAADQFPEEYRDTVFIGNPVTGRVNHDRLKWHGSSPQAIEQPDFISCDDPWFRPVDLKLGPDGALYIADFYNKIIGHYEVPLTHPGRDRHRGRIWRVSYRPDERPKADRVVLADLATKELVERLANANLTVRLLATEELASRADLPANELLLPNGDDEPSVLTRAHGLWLIERRGGLDESTIRRLADDASRLVRTHLLKALAERAEWADTSLDLAGLVRSKLADDDAFVRRAAADALGRHPSADSVEPLVKLLASTPADDTHLIHVVRMALRDHLLVEGMYGQVAPLAANADFARRLADVSLGAPTPAAAQYLFDYARRDSTDGGQLARWSHHVARYLAEEKLSELYPWAEKRVAGQLGLAREVALALHRAAQARGLAPPERFARWAAELGRQLLSANEQPLVQGGIELARELRLRPLHEELAALATDQKRPAELRASALEACVVNDAALARPLLAQVLGDAGEAMPLRQKAAGALANLPEPEARDVLVKQLRIASDRLAVEVAAALALRRDGGEQLLGEVAAGRASARLLQERIVSERLHQAGVPDVDSRLSKLTANLPPADERIQQLIAGRREAYAQAQPNVAAGRQVFQKTCAACHRLGGEGAKIGPDLDGVGLRGLDRLLEDVLDPSRNIDQAFRATVINTSDGRTLSGLVLREEGAVLVLADAQGKEIRVPLDDIEERAIARLSPMPANVADLVPDGDFLNLMAFLLSQRSSRQ